MPHDLSETAFQQAILDALETTDSNGLHYTAFTRYHIVYDPKAAVPQGQIHYNRHHALLPSEFPAFVASSQSTTWQQLQAEHGTQAARRLTESLRQALDHRGTLDVLRRGITIDGVDVDVTCFPPTDGNPEDTAWRHNRFTVLEELEYDQNQPEGHRGRLDLVLFLNGIPLVTVELKNLGTGQTVGNAIEQYEQTRSDQAALFRFPYRALVHFVVDQRRAFMTTRVRGPKTLWFPYDAQLVADADTKQFPSPRTAHLWQDLWRPCAMLQWLQELVVLQPPAPPAPGKPPKHLLQDAALIFPRFQQRRAVLAMLGAMVQDGPGRRYLVQHSTGSGKSYSIGWLAMMATGLHRAGERAFHKVLVVSDRRIIHRQLRDLVRTLSPADVNVDELVAAVDEGTTSFVEAMQGARPIIVSTVHAFFHGRQHIARQEGRRFCVIIDEAHRSQGGDLNRAMRSVLDELGTEEAANVSMVAFTATPTDLTLQRFGRRVSEKEYRPHESYTMHQARQERFIVNVLQNYVLWKQEASATTQARDEQQIRQGGPTLQDLLAQDEEMIRLKARAVAEHFLQTVKPQLADQALAMVVTVSKDAALRYRTSLLEALEERGGGRRGRPHRLHW